MCGITGYVDYECKVDPNILGKMTKAIVYRGPDSSGEYVNDDKSAGLGIRRLSIIDLSTGDQPIKNEDSSVVVVFNGEIYGYKNLRDDLLRKGHKLKTKSDTEVLVHLYEEYGEGMVAKLNGMFAFAIWDEKKRRMFIARDRSGIKPLYYSVIGKKLFFGSEPKTILECPGYKKGVDSTGLSSFFYLGYILGSSSIYSNIFRLKPGNILIFDKSGIKIKKYFDIKTKKDYPQFSLDMLLRKAVEKQLIADVPVGVFLSGGLDSSLIASYISKYEKLKSFSIGFSEKGFDESKHAYYVAKKLGTEHYSDEFSPKDVLSIFDEISSKLDEPFADASLFPTYKVSKLARKYVKVVLSGDGGDELFGGYPIYQAHILARYLNFLPNFTYDVLRNIIDSIPDIFFDLIPTSFKEYPKKRLAKIILSGMKKGNPQDRHLYWMRTFFLGNEFLGNTYDRKHNSKSDNWKKLSPSITGQSIDFNTYLPDDFFFKVDRAAMYNSLEVRVPFLDNDVLNYAFSTRKPHVNLLQTKIQLRKLLQDRLPDVARRPKKGFGIPLEKWLRSDLKDFAYSKLKSRRLNDYVSKNKVLKIWGEHQKSETNHSGTIWQLVIFSAWLDNWS